MLILRPAVPTDAPLILQSTSVSWRSTTGSGGGHRHRGRHPPARFLRAPPGQGDHGRVGGAAPGSRLCEAWLAGCAGCAWPLHSSRGSGQARVASLRVLCGAIPTRLKRGARGGCSRRQPRCRVAKFICERCSSAMWVANEAGKVKEPAACESQACGAKQMMKLMHNQCLYSDKQLVKIQESPNLIPEGETPHAVTAFVYDALVDFVRPGDRVTLVGALRIAPPLPPPRLLQPSAPRSGSPPRRPASRRRRLQEARAAAGRAPSCACSAPWHCHSLRRRCAGSYVDACWHTYAVHSWPVVAMLQSRVPLHIIQQMTAQATYRHVPCTPGTPEPATAHGQVGASHVHRRHAH